MKYITWQTPMNDHIILFPSELSHDQVALSMGIKTQDLLGAGYVQQCKLVENEGIVTKLCCTGSSVSLGVGSRYDIDDKLLNSHLKR